MGQKSTYTEEKGDKLCELLAEGNTSLRAACRQLELKPSTVMTWAKDNPAFAEQYTRAREIGDDIEFEDLVDLASEAPPKVAGRVDQGWVTHQKNLVDARKWSLARRRPKKYGDFQRSEVKMDGSLELKNLTDAELNGKLTRLISIAIPCGQA